MEISETMQYYQEQLKEIRGRQKSRRQNNIVIVTDDREDLAAILKDFDKRVEVLRIPSMTFQDVFHTIKLHSKFGKGTIFVFSGGTFDLLHNSILPDCKMYDCPFPQQILTVPKYNANHAHLINRALNLNMNLLDFTTDDIAIFCGLMPIPFEQYYGYLIDNRQCFSRHIAKIIPYGEKNNFTNYRIAVKWYNDFTKYHANAIFIDPLDFEKSYFSEPLQTIFAPDYFSICHAETTRRCKLIKSLCIKVLTTKPAHFNSQLNSSECGSNFTQQQEKRRQSSDTLSKTPLNNLNIFEDDVSFSYGRSLSSTSPSDYRKVKTSDKFSYTRCDLRDQFSVSKHISTSDRFSRSPHSSQSDQSIAFSPHLGPVEQSSRSQYNSPSHHSSRSRHKSPSHHSSRSRHKSQSHHSSRSRHKSPSHHSSRSRHKSPSHHSSRSQHKSPSHHSSRSQHKSPKYRTSRSRLKSPSFRSSRSRDKSPSYKSCSSRCSNPVDPSSEQKNSKDLCSRSQHVTPIDQSSKPQIVSPQKKSSRFKNVSPSNPSCSTMHHSDHKFLPEMFNASYCHSEERKSKSIAAESEVCLPSPNSSTSEELLGSFRKSEEKETLGSQRELRRRLGDELFEEYAVNLEVARSSFNRKFELYRHLPQMYKNYYEYYNTFSALFNAQYGSNGNQEHKSNLWNSFWQSRYEEIKSEEWQKERKIFLDKYIEKAAIKPTAATSPLSLFKSLSASQISNLQDPVPVVSEESLSLMESVCDELSHLGPALRVVIEKCRALGATNKEAYSVLTNPDNLIILKLALTKLKALHHSSTGDARIQYGRVVNWIMFYSKSNIAAISPSTHYNDENKLIDNIDKRNLEPILCKKEPSFDIDKMPVDLNKLADATEGKGNAETFDIIKTALMYKGVLDPSHQVIHDIFLKVSSVHFTRSFKSK